MAIPRCPILDNVSSLCVLGFVSFDCSMCAKLVIEFFDCFGLNLCSIGSASALNLVMIMYRPTSCIHLLVTIVLKSSETETKINQNAWLNKLTFLRQAEKTLTAVFAFGDRISLNGELSF